MTSAKKLLTAAAGTVLVTMATGGLNKAHAFSIQYDTTTSNVTAGTYNYNFQFDDPAEVVVLSGKNFSLLGKTILSKDFLTLSGMEGVVSNSVSGLADNAYNVANVADSNRSHKAKWKAGPDLVAFAAAIFSGTEDLIQGTLSSSLGIGHLDAFSFVKVNSGNTFGTFTVNAPNTVLGEINYRADYTANASLSGVGVSPLSLNNCGSLLNGTCSGTTQGPVAMNSGPGSEPVPEPASMLGIMTFGALGGRKLLKRKKKSAEA